MGFNLVFTLRVSELDAIAADESFASTLGNAIHLATEEPLATGAVVDSVHAGTHQYRITAHSPQYDDTFQVFATKGGELICLDDPETRSFAGCEILTEVMARAGHVVRNRTYPLRIEIEDEGLAYARTGDRAHPVKLDDTSFADAFVSFLFLVDGIDRLDGAANLGAQIKDLVTGYRARLLEMQDDVNSTGRVPYLAMCDTIPLATGGACSAPITILGIHPEGEAAALVVGHNSGHVLYGLRSLPHMMRRDYSPEGHTHYEQIRERNLEILRDTLLWSGFDVMEKDKRSFTMSYARERKAIPRPEGGLQSYPPLLSGPRRLVRALNTISLFEHDRGLSPRPKKGEAFWMEKIHIGDYPGPYRPDDVVALEYAPSNFLIWDHPGTGVETGRQLMARMQRVYRTASKSAASEIRSALGFGTVKDIDPLPDLPLKLVFQDEKGAVSDVMPENGKFILQVRDENIYTTIWNTIDDWWNPLMAADDARKAIEGAALTGESERTRLIRRSLKL